MDLLFLKYVYNKWNIQQFSTLSECKNIRQNKNIINIIVYTSKVSWMNTFIIVGFLTMKKKTCRYSLGSNSWVEYT